MHVFFHDGSTVEVSTFRRDPDPEEQRGEPGELLITSDNTYGTPRQDAFRRDFTVNALFYDVADYSVIDYVGGIEDLERRLIRAIGEPERALPGGPGAHAARLRVRGPAGLRHRDPDAGGDPPPPQGAREGLAGAGDRGDRPAPASCGHAGAAMQWMLELGLLEVLLPEAYAMLTAGARGLGDFGQILPVIDRMVAAERRDLPDTGAPRGPPAAQGHAAAPRHRGPGGQADEPRRRSRS